MRRSERMSAILEALTDSGTVQVGDLARRFAVSEATMRRDLALLEEQRLLTRTHGGALAQDVAYELPVRYRDGHRRDAKRAIARLAVRRLPSGPHVNRKRPNSRGEVVSNRSGTTLRASA